jgi:cobalt-zinc-cadmium efflux system outer membrane protein
VTIFWRLGCTTGVALAMLGTTRASAQSLPPPTAREWTLEDVLTSALAQHPLVEAAQARVAAARGGRDAAGTFPNPVGTVWVENATFPGQGSLAGVSRETSAYVTLPLEPLFQRKPRVRSAEEVVKATGAELIGERRNVALDAAHAFYRVAAAQMSLDAADEQRVAVEELVAYNRKRVGAGATAELELMRVEVELDRATTSVALARIDVARSWADLYPFLGVAQAATSPRGMEAAHLPRVRVPDAPAAALSMTVADLVTRAREQRPEMVAARARVAAATADAAYQRTLAIRSLGATFGFKQANGDSTMIAGISVPLPVFDRNRGDIQRTANEALAVEKELAWTGRRLEAEVRGASDAAQQLAAQTGARQRSTVERAADVHRITLAAYQEGATSLLQVLDAARTLADTRLIYNRTLLAQQQSAFDLALAVGMEPLPSTSIFPPALPPSVGGTTDRGASR